MERATAFAPGRVNLIGEHTDYNGGLSLPFAIGQGVTVTAAAREGDWILVTALDVGESRRFPLGSSERDPDGGWTEFVRGAIAEMQRDGHRLTGADLQITGNVPPGGGLSSSAALEAALVLALLAISDLPQPPDRVSLARLCSRVENDWVGARTGLLDQLASLCGRPGHALLIDFRSTTITPVPLQPGDWTFVTVPSGEDHSLAAGSGYETRRAECERARDQLRLTSLRDATLDDVADLPEPLNRRVRHVVEENARVRAAVDALGTGDFPALGRLLTSSHVSLRDLYESSTPAVEHTVARLMACGAAGARMVGGGFGGHVLALLAPGVAPPDDATIVVPADGARLL